jgi:hypothetical protein
MATRSRAAVDLQRPGFQDLGEAIFAGTVKTVVV